MRTCAGLVARDREGLVARERVGLVSFRGGVRRLKLSLLFTGLPFRLKGLWLPLRLILSSLVGLRLPSRLTGLRLPFRLILPSLSGLRLPPRLRLPNRLVGLRLARRTGLPFALALERVTVKSSSSRGPNPNSASESDSGKGEREGTVEKDMAPGERDMAGDAPRPIPGDAPRPIPGDAPTPIPAGVPVPRDIAPGDIDASLGAGVNISKSTPECLVGDPSTLCLNPVRRGVGVTGVASGLTAIIVIPSTLRGLIESGCGARKLEPDCELESLDCGACEFESVRILKIDAGAGDPFRKIDAGDPFRTIDAGDPNALPLNILDAGDLSKFDPGE